MKKGGKKAGSDTGPEDRHIQFVHAIAASHETLGCHSGPGGELLKLQAEVVHKSNHLCKELLFIIIVQIHGNATGEDQI